MRVRIEFISDVFGEKVMTFNSCTAFISFWRRMAGMAYDITSLTKTVSLEGLNGFHACLMDYGFFADLSAMEIAIFP